MKQKSMFILVLVISLTFLAAGCVPTQIYSQRVGKPDLSKLNTFYVVTHNEDSGGLDEAVAGELTKLGFQVSKGAADSIPNDMDALVTYEYQWFWDLGTYLLMLRILIRNPDTNFPYAMGESLRPSLARLEPEGMAREILAPLFNP